MQKQELRKNPTTVVEGFRAAIAASDAGAAEALSTATGWTSAGDSARRLYTDAVRAGLKIELAGAPAIVEKKAAVELLIRGNDAKLHRLWALLHEGEDGWRIEGVTKVKPAVGLFLAGSLPAILEWPALSPSEEAKKWAEGFVANPAGIVGPEAISLIRVAHNSQIQVGPAVVVPAVDRHGVALRFRRDGAVEERYATLGREGENLVVVAVSHLPSIESLLSGVTVTWEEGKKNMSTEDKTGEGSKKGEKPTAEQSRQVVEQAIVEALRKMGENKDGPVTAEDVQSRLPEVVLGLFSTVLEEAKHNLPRKSGAAPTGDTAANGEVGGNPSPGVANTGDVDAADPDDAPPVALETTTADVDGPEKVAVAEPVLELPVDPDNLVSLDAARQARQQEGPNEFEQKVQGAVRDALNQYVQEHVPANQDEVAVDAAFFKEHGPALAGTLFGALAKAIIPPEVKVEVPVTSAEGGEPRKVALKLDLAGLVNGFMKKALITRETAANNTPPEDPGPEEAG